MACLMKRIARSSMDTPASAQPTHTLLGVSCARVPATAFQEAACSRESSICAFASSSRT